MNGVIIFILRQKCSSHSSAHEVKTKKFELGVVRNRNAAAGHCVGQGRPGLRDHLLKRLTDYRLLRFNNTLFSSVAEDHSRYLC